MGLYFNIFWLCIPINQNLVFRQLVPLICWITLIYTLLTLKYEVKTHIHKSRLHSHLHSIKTKTGPFVSELEIICESRTRVPACQNNTKENALVKHAASRSQNRAQSLTQYAWYGHGEQVYSILQGQQGIGYLSTCGTCVGLSQSENDLCSVLKFKMTKQGKNDVFTLHCVTLPVSIIFWCNSTQETALHVKK